ncbi:DUF6884 domain-containing protein [Cupriavidus basilensis]
MQTLILIACSGRKLDHPAPARELYQGELFKSSVAYAERAGLPWAVLSAKLGLVRPDDTVLPYEQRLSGRLAEQAAWAARVVPQLAALAAAEIVFLAGADYRRHLTHWCETEGIHWRAPLAGLSIGRQLAQIKAMYRALPHSMPSASIL